MTTVIKGVKIVSCILLTFVAAYAVLEKKTQEKHKVRYVKLM